MKRTRMLGLATIVLLAGCGTQRDESTPPLTFEQQGDTAHLSQGRPVLEGIRPSREPNGSLRVRGAVNFPDGVRIQISLYREGTTDMLGRVQVIVRQHRFESSPIIGPRGPLPHGRYRFEYLALFNVAWQSADVLRRTDDGRSLRGPGITRDRVGGAAFYLVEERTL